MFLDRYALATLPRYTSYPPADRFGDGVGAADYAAWLGSVRADQSLSLYLHIPFCRQLCWYCGCHTAVTRDPQRLARYVGRLERELDMVAGRIPAHAGVVTVHLGGGSPTILQPALLEGLMAEVRRRLPLRPGAEVAVEIDPRGLDRLRVEALAAAGITRASLGVQDFNPRVQAAINRVQPVEVVAAAVSALRAAGIDRINADVMYGLPGQTAGDVAESARVVSSLGVDRVAAFGYAHVPWARKHQIAIDPAALPGARARYEQAAMAREVLLSDGYRAIGFDHYARPDDPLAVAAAEGRLRRSFQGYTDDPADVTLGLGASAIGALSQGFVQNATHLRDWAEAVDAGRLPTVRGARLDAGDRLRGAVIERILCDGEADVVAVADRLGVDADLLDLAFNRALPLVADGLAEIDGPVVRATARGRPYVRHLAACFDPGLAGGTGRHSLAV